MSEVARLEPQPLWRYFVDLGKIPRCSKHEEAAITWIAQVGADHGCETERDRVGNLLIRVPASKGCEDAPPVAIQSHADMVCEKNSDVDHDFTRDPIRMVVDSGDVRAEGTTLGADNGIGVAAALAFLDAPDAVHGPLELLFTIDEETGLTGAFGIEPGFLRARYMINLDSEEIGVFTVGCAGGRDARILWQAPRTTPPAGSVMRLTVQGLQGGHSGTDIHKNRGNSIKILARLLLAAADDLPAGALMLGALSSGSKRNAIPREGHAEVFLAEGQAETARRAIEREAERVRAQLAETDPGFAMELKPAPEGTRFTGAAESLRLLRMIDALPQGVLAMSVAIPTLVETSNNVGVLEDLGEGYRIICATRSSLAPALTAAQAQLRAVALLGGAEIELHAGYPGWQPNLKSPLLARAKAIYQRLFGKEGRVGAIHAGLECGLFTDKYPDLDIISYGADITGAHSPDERVGIESVAKLWELTGALLEDLTRAEA
ncbi:MAG: aminoacyl-histidine dipeptidase [Candidatus Eisenbacteria sp.]|nr:aminoacyl-histidine dipeptidase [Candidatus Eisenbacteria bacterium]